MNEPYRLRYTNQAVGVFLLIVLAFLILLSVWILRAGDYFKPQDHYWIEVPQENVRDLYKGAEVMILGERAGQIESIRYVDSSDQVRVNLSIDPEMRDQIFSDSVVRQERKFGLGTPILVIRRGTDPQADRTPLPPGNRLASYQGESDRIDQVARQVESVSESIRLIQERLDPTLVSVGTASDRLAQTLQQTADPALIQTQRAAAAFLQTNQTVSEVVDNDVRETLDEIRRSSQSVRVAAGSITDTSQGLNRDMSGTLTELREAAVQVQKLAVQTQELVKVLRGEADQLPGTTQRVNDTVSDTQDLVGEIRSHPLLRRYSTQGLPSSQVSPSAIRGGAVRP